jgi:hypothetical protein
MDHAHGLLIIHGWVEAVLAIAAVHITICIKWEINPKYENVLN